MSLASELEQALAGLAESDLVDVFDGEERLPHLTNFQFEIREQGGKLMLHLWNEHGNLARRVLALAESRAGFLVLDVARFGKRKPGRLQIVRRSRAQSADRIGREQYRILFKKLVQEKFPDETVESLTTARDLQHSLSGCYVRGVMHAGGRAWALVGVSSAEPREVQDRILTFALIWLDWVRSHIGRRALAGLRIFLPKGQWAQTAHRVHALTTTVRMELFEVDESLWRVNLIDTNDTGNLDTWLTPQRDLEMARDAARSVIDRITGLAPEAIQVGVPPGTRDVALRFRGLEFARWHAGQLEFGLTPRRRLLVSNNWNSLKRLVRKLERYRSPDSKDKNHPVYRAQPERWLEDTILRDPLRIDAHLRPEYLYSQVPAFSAGDRGVMDLLGARLDGRLVVIEIKAAEDIHMILQAADYWLRVWLHQKRGEFESHGYFRGVELQDKPPLLYLVAPGFQFHPTTDAILKCMSPEIEIVQIGLNEEWRQGIQVIFRK